MHKTFIKAGQIGNLTDARYFAAWSVKWLGLCLNSAKEQFLSPSEAAAIKNWVQGPQMVGEFGIQTPEEIMKLMEMLQLEAVQIGPLSNLEVAKKLRHYTLLKEIAIDQSTSFHSLKNTLAEFAPYSDFFLLNFRLHQIDWISLQNNESLSVSDLKSLCQLHPIILAIEVHPEQVKELLHAVNPHGLEVIGGMEEKVGLKSFEELDSLFEVMDV